MDPELFATCGRTFLAILDGAQDLTLEERVEAITSCLAQLYFTGLYLPTPEVERPLPRPAPMPELSDWPGLGALDAYWHVADPHRQSAAEAGSLSEDLYTVLAAVHRGLDLLDVDPELALQWWRDSFETTWGDRAVRALRVLHRGVARFREEPRQQRRLRRKVAAEDPVWREGERPSMSLLAPGAARAEPDAPPSAETTLGLRCEPAVAGVEVIEVHPRGPAAGLLQPGDLVLSVQGVPIDGLPAEVIPIVLAGETPGLPRALEVYRHGESLVVEVTPVLASALR